MTNDIEVGSHYRNPTGEYEILEIDGMWATVRYEDGSTKRHLLAALKIHWENNQAAVAAATPKPKPASPFPVDETAELIASIIRLLTTSEGVFVPRQDIVNALLSDPRGKELVDKVHKDQFYRTEEWIAGTMLDQFAKDLERKGSPVYQQFDREQKDNTWAYRPR
jgi:hypothetical protein